MPHPHSILAGRDGVLWIRTTLVPKPVDQTPLDFVTCLQHPARGRIRVFYDRRLHPACISMITRPTPQCCSCGTEVSPTLKVAMGAGAHLCFPEHCCYWPETAELPRPGQSRFSAIPAAYPCPRVGWPSLALDPAEYAGNIKRIAMIVDCAA